MEDILCLRCHKLELNVQLIHGGFTKISENLKNMIKLKMSSKNPKQF